MDTEEIVKRMNELSAEIERHNIFYYVLCRPVITDFAFDGLLAELKALEQQHPALASPNSPTQIVGCDQTPEFVKTSHTHPMLSLDNTYNPDEAGDRLLLMLRGLSGDDIEVVVEPKVDGAAVEIRYLNGEFFQALTRGDGSAGDDVTENVRQIINLPKFLNSGPLACLPNVALRGEVYMPFERFEAYNQKLEDAGEDLMANPRNAAAGTLKSKRSAVVRERGLHVMIHGTVPKMEDALPDYLSFSDAVRAESLPMIQHYAVLRLSEFDGSVDRMAVALKELLVRCSSARLSLPYPTDGCVIKLNRFSHRRWRGEGTKSPYWAYAYKFEPEAAQTLLKSITLQVGRTGAITPVAELEPVQLAGTLVSRATLHNFEEVLRKDIREGDMVEVVKAGEIIPAVTKVLVDRSKVFNTPTVPPTQCPSCSSTLEKDGANLFCRRVECPAKHQQMFEHFVSRDAMNIQHLGPKYIRRLLEVGIISQFEDFYRATRDQLLQVPGFRDAQADRILEEIDRSRMAGPDKLLYAFGIPHVGRTASKAILAHFGGDLERVFKDATKEKLMEIDGVGETIAESLMVFIQSKDLRDAPAPAWSDAAGAGPESFIRGWANLGVCVFRAPAAEKKTGGRLDGETWVITGELSQPRHHFAAVLEGAGAKVAGSVSKKTNFLLVGAAAGQTKLNKARDMGVVLVSEDELQARLNA